MHRKHLLIFSLLAAVWAASSAFAESQENEYKGITDPFGDPANYEFAEDEKEDKEYFHLGRFLMFGFDFGAGIFTGNLGKSAGSGFMSGVKLIYFFDSHIGFEAAAHYAFHTDVLRPTSTDFATLDVQVVPLTGAFRYYFDTKDSPRALAIANPYLVFGAGAYLRSEKVTGGNLPFTVANGFSGNFGICAGAGMEFNIYRRHVYLGIDARYHVIWFDDQATGITKEGGTVVVPAADRAGNYVTALLSLSYNF
ncbi:MAG: hypothetical protein HYR96_07955 [Deltaproteobacteria bacterium]|nr:hypothetical protein [Deltaproteobacteria bacterium]MBI3293441.1 hypothetical protein [Deltaproteobacteria bacterium]